MGDKQHRPHTGLLDHRPTQEEGPSAVYAYGKQGYTGNSLVDGLFGPSSEGGFGLFRGGGRDDKTGLTGSADVVYGDFYNGRRSDGTVGMGIQGGLFSGSAGYEDHGVMGKVNANILTGRADAHVGPNDAGFALGASVLNGGFEVGTKDKNSKADSTFGLSGSLLATPGASAHLLYGDSDGDGYREYGFDMSGMFGLGFGMKMTTEDPLRTALGTFAGPAANLIPKDINLTEQAGNAAAAAGGAIADGAGWAWDKASQGVGWAGDKLGEGASWAGNKVSEGASWAGDQLSSAGGAIKDGWNSIWN